jgi:hypothetical protein
MVDKKTQIIQALDSWIRQRPGLEFGNYGDWTAYRSEMRSIGKDLQHARAMLNYVAWHDSITAEMILDAAQSGRLSIKAEGDKVTIDYCTGQYWPTEYRPAVCRLLSSVIWHWMRDNMPKPVTMHNSETGEDVHRIDGLRIGDYLRRQAFRELGASISRRWFT